MCEKKAKKMHGITLAREKDLNDDKKNQCKYHMK
jgi:hypothetical protein